MALEAPHLAEYLSRAFAAEEQHQVLGFPREATSRTGFRYFTPRELEVLTDRAAVYYIQHGLSLRVEGNPPLVVGLWGPGTIEWVATFFALILMGHAPFVIAPKLSREAVEGLMKKANGNIFIIPSPKASEDVFWPESIPFIDPKELESEVSSGRLIQSRCTSTAIDPSDLAFIVHSSGTTGLPKIFKNSHIRVVMQTKRGVTWSPPTDRNWVSSAVYNIIGLRQLLLCPLKTQPQVYDNDRLPFTAEGLVGILEEVQPASAWVTTYSLEMIMAHPRGHLALAKCENVIHFGAVLSKELGDDLVGRGIGLSTAFGMTEIGSLLSSRTRPKGDVDWDYLMPLDHIKEHLLFRPINLDGTGDYEDQLHELICLPGFPGVDETIMTSRDPPGSFHVGDLFLKHPSKENRWKIVGRIDDQLKVYFHDRQAVVDCLEYEGRIKHGNEDLLEEVVLFGQGGSKLGVLVFAENATEATKATVIERVWAKIQNEINETLKIGIDKDMIVVVAGAPAQSLPRSTKMTLIRPQIYMRYKQEIENACRRETDVLKNE